MSTTTVAATAVESAAMESTKRMTTAEMSSTEAMAEEMVSPIVVPPIVAAEATKPPVADVGAVIRSHNPISSASAKQKDGGSSYQKVYFPHVNSPSSYCSILKSAARSNSCFSFADNSLYWTRTV